MNALTRPIVLLLALTLVAGTLLTAGAPPARAAPQLSTRTHIFYYPWYQNPEFSGFYRHWQERSFTPPKDISSDYYPALGAYDSGDFAGAVTQQMQQIQQAGVGVIVYSWWGQGSAEDAYVAGTMDVAERFGIKVAWHIEPYDGRSAASVVRDMAYINSHYGSHPAFFRDADRGDKGVFYIYNSLLIRDWSPLAAVRTDNIVLANTTDFSRVANFDGMYTYAIASGLAQGWADASAYAQKHNLIWAPSIGPGYIDDRAVPGNTSPTLDRSNGATYDLEWQTALNPVFGVPTWITITSFNEWHEGSQIEAASSTPPFGFGYRYLTYQFAYGQTGAQAELAYINRTKVWVDMFDPQTANLIPNASFETSGGASTNAAKWTEGNSHRRSGETIHSGSWALKSAFTGGGTDTRTAAISITPNITYTLSGWVYKASGTGVACMDLNDISGELQMCASPLIGWQLLSGTWNSGSNSSVVVRLVTGSNPNGPIYFDDIMLTVASRQP